MWNFICEILKTCLPWFSATLYVTETKNITFLLAGIAFGPALSLPQEEGYNYDPPDNPLVITRPPRPQPRPTRPPEVDQGRRAEPQEGGGGHHHDSDDPLAWLRDSVPGL